MSEEVKTIKCPLCYTRISIRTQDAGRNIKCPECFKVFPIKIAEDFDKATAKKPIPEDDADPYLLKEEDPATRETLREMGNQALEEAHQQAIERSQRDKLSYQQKQEKEFNQRASEGFESVQPPKPRERLMPDDYDPREKLVDYPLEISGKAIQQDIEFLFDSNLLLRMMFMSLGMLISLNLLYNASYFAGYIPANFATYFFSLMLSIMFLLTFLGTMAFVCGAFMHISTSIASGSKELDWPELSIFDRILEVVFIAIAFCLGAVPAGVLGTFVHPVLGMIGSLMTYFLFPVAYLSMLESGSMFNPYSPAILESLTKKPMKWFLFHLLTMVPLAAALLLIAICLYFTYPARIFYGLIPCAFLMVFYAIYYGWMVGKIGWECAQIQKEKQGQSDESEAASMPES